MYLIWEMEPQARLSLTKKASDVNYKYKPLTKILNFVCN
jgi:hypothetical protein